MTDSEEHEVKTCPSCGFDFQSHTQGELCWYCWYRGYNGASKFLVFKAILENKNKWVDVDEILKLTNKQRKKIGKKELKNTKAIYPILERYTRSYKKDNKKEWNRLLLKRKKGRKNTFRLGSRLIKRMARYEKRWIQGYSLYISKKPLTSEENRKATAIRNKLATEQYDLYEYLMV